MTHVTHLNIQTHEGWSKINVPSQNLKMAFWQEPFVQGGCPSHSLEYSWVHLTVRRTASSDKRFLSKGNFQILTGDIFFWSPFNFNVLWSKITQAKLNPIRIYKVASTLSTCYTNLNKFVIGFTQNRISLTNNRLN